MGAKQGKTVKDSSLVRRYHVLDGDLNPRGVLYGGRFVAIIDALAARVARNHAGSICVTASMDSIHFLSPVYVDETLEIRIAANCAWNTSLEIGVKVLVKRERKLVHVGSAYLTFVAIDETGKPIKVPSVIPESSPEKRRHREAQTRRALRLAHRPQKNP